jgi:hypothetical protein
MRKSTKLGVLLTIAMGIAAQGACAAQNPASHSWDKPTAALAQKISDILGPGQARLTIENKSSIAAGEVPRIRKLLEEDLKTHGVLVSGAESASAVRVTLSENVRERLWVAEIAEGNRTQVAMVELGPVAEAPSQQAGGVTLRTQTILTTHEPVLAALEVPNGMIVLEPEQMVLYERGPSGWQEAKNASARQRGPMTRDPRGVLVATGDGHRFEAWLNGTQCTGAVSAPDATSDWEVECRASDDPWPIVFDASGVPQLKAFYNSSRDYFVGVVTPASGVDLPPFYSGTTVPRPAGGAALLIGGIDGRVQLVENGALWQVAGTRDWGSDFAVLRSGCGTGTQIIASGSGEAQHDSLRAYELPALEAVPASAPWAVDGMVTAVWSAPDGKSVFAAVRDANDQYEVDRVTALCN